MSHDHHHMHHAMSTTPTPMMMGGGNMSGTMNHSHHHQDHHMMNMTNNGTGGHDMHGNHNDMQGDHGMHGMHGMMDMDMKMYFHTGISETVLFEGCKVETNRDMAVACVVVFMAAVLYEGLKFAREVLLQNSLKERSAAMFLDRKMPPGTASQEQMVMATGSRVSVSNQMLSGSHAVQTFLHVIQIFVSYCLMLVFMTYNVWLCLAVVLGAGVGYFAFGWKRAVVVDANEHCH